MQRLAVILIAISVLIGVAMPNHHASSAELNQQILVDSPDNLTSGGTTGRATDESEVSPSYGGHTTLDRAPNGHFSTEASINGQSLPFVVDTGASSVALTVDAARQIGLYVDPSSFTVVGTGASGATRGKLVTLGRVTVAGRTVEHVDGVILEGLEVNLLGQSVLTRLGGVEMNGDKMVLR